MGTDIHGWVEVQEVSDVAKTPCNKEWHGIIKIDNLVCRNYDMFSNLFGVTSYAQFTPIAAHRGLPSDISDEASADYLEWEEVCGETWITWSEIAAIDWMEDALDRRPHRYEHDAEGNLVFVGKSAPCCSYVLEAGNTWQEGTITYKVEHITRQQALTSDYKLLFQ